MATLFPARLSTNDTTASAAFENACINAGYVGNAGTDLPGRMIDVVQNLLTDLPSNISLPTNFGMGGISGAVTSGYSLIKKVTAIADNTATTVLTVTVPNSAHAGVVQVTIVGIAGAGGAIGTCEDVTSVTYNISICRTPGVAMGATVSTAFGSAAAVVAGAGTMTTVGAITLNGEGVTLTNTASFKATVDQSSTAANHICMVYATVINHLGTGITIS